MIYNTKNRRNGASECKNVKKTCFNAHFQYSQSTIMGLNKILKMWSLKSLAILKCESGTSLLEVQCKWQPGSVFIICSYYVLIILRMVSLGTLFLYYVGLQAWLCSYFVLNFFLQNQGFCSYKIVLIKKRV